MKITLSVELEGLKVINLLHIELYKLFRSKSFFIIFIISTILEIITPLDSHGNITAYENIGVSFYNVCLLMIFPILLGAITFGNDFLERTINNEICAGHKRGEIFISKVLAYFIGVNLILLLSPAINIIINHVLGRYIANNSIIDGDILLKTFLTTALLGMAVSSVSIFIAFVFKDIGKTVGISVGVYFLNVVCINSADNLKESIFKFLPLAQMRLILYRPLILNQFREAAFSGIITLLFFLTLSYFYFKKTELGI